MTARIRNLKATMWLVVIALLGIATALAGVVVPMLHDDLEKIPAAERRALYERTLDTLSNSCLGPNRTALSDYCHGQADFIRRLPECTGECRELADRVAPRPSR